MLFLIVIGNKTLLHVINTNQLPFLQVCLSLFASKITALKFEMLLRDRSVVIDFRKFDDTRA